MGDFDRTSPLTWITLAAGAVLLLVAWHMDAAWFDAHILPSFSFSRRAQWTVAVTVRAGLALAGLMIVLVARPLLVRHARERDISRTCLIALSVLIAAVAAIVSSEMVLRAQPWRSFQARNMQLEPRRQADERLGWTHIPGHTGSNNLIGDRRTTYSFDGHGYRVSRPGLETDLAAPSILFIGESVMLGFGLDWDETVPARVKAELGVSTVNLAVTGYSNDQAYMRLRDDLPRFGCPIGVVSIFMPSLLDRNLNTDRPHLDAALRWHEPRIGWRLAALARHALRYRRERSIERGVAMTSAVLRATTTMAQSRGAWTLIVVPTFLPEGDAERTIRHRVLDDAGLDYVLVPLDRRLRIVGDGHPDGRAAALIASAIVSRLQRDPLTQAAPRHAAKLNLCASNAVAAATGAKG